jgi:hypothetical protein
VNANLNGGWCGIVPSKTGIYTNDRRDLCRVNSQTDDGEDEKEAAQMAGAMRVRPILAIEYEDSDTPSCTHLHALGWQGYVTKHVKFSGPRFRLLAWGAAISRVDPKRRKLRIENQDLD